MEKKLFVVASKQPLPPGLYSSVVSGLVVTAEPVAESRSPVGPEVLISVL
jgi:hypothetical protein